MPDPQPIDYQTPQARRTRSTGANFAIGLFVGLLASAAGWGLGIGLHDLTILGIAIFLLLFGKTIAALFLSINGRHRGMAAGLLLSIGIVALIFGGLCFAAFQLFKNAKI